MRIPSGRSRILLVVGVVVAVAAATTFFVLRDDDGLSVETIAPATGENVADDLAGGDEGLLYTSGTLLKERSLTTGEDEELEDLSTNEIYASPGTSWIAYVTGGDDDENASVPHVRMLDVASGDERDLGPGFNVSWAPGGRALGFLRPQDEGTCSAVLCSGDSEIVLVDVRAEEVSVTESDDKFALLGWSGDYLLAARRDDPDRTWAFHVDGSSKELDVPPNEIVSTSPDGRWLVRTSDDGVRLHPMEAGELAGEPEEIADLEVSSPAWSPDSTRLAVVVTRPSTGDTERVVLVRRLAELLDMDEGEVETLLAGRKKRLAKAYRELRESDPDKAKEAAALVAEFRTAEQIDPGNTEVAVLDLEDGELEPVGQSFGVTGRLLWAPEGDRIVFSRLSDPGQGTHQTLICSLDEDDRDCDALFTWSMDVTLLRMQ
ncbi:MAG TPA: hypothetical protein VFS18_04680 [Actinomycetota bacterium]|nr:hypothetical protein [Actinomycetota bacterium]